MAQATDEVLVNGTHDQKAEALIARVPEVDPSREYVASGLDIGLSQLIKALPRYADDIQTEQGDEIYDRMMKDPAVFTAVQTLTEIVLLNDVRVEPAVTEEEDPDYELSKEIAEFVENNLWHLQRPLNEVLTEMMNAFVYGCCVAEKIYEIKITQRFGVMMHLKAVKPLARPNYQFVVDDYGNVIGFMARLPGQSAPRSLVRPEDVIPRDKFAVLSFGVSGGDPRGRSQIRPAYNSWWFKLNTYPRWLKYIQQFSTPSLIGFTPEAESGDNGFVELRDANGQLIKNNDGTTKKITKEQAMLNAMIQFQAGSAIALRGGSKVDLVQSDGNGEAFVKTFDALNREIFVAIIGNSRANLEAEHGSKADSESGQDSLSRKAEWVRQHLEEMLNRDLVHQIVSFNYGADVAEKLMPWATLKAADKEDRSKIMSAISSLWTAGYFDDSQVQGLDALMGAPERDMEAWLARREEDRDMEVQSQKAMNRVSDPMQGEE